MRAYLAVIVDSFHEALVSRVLWILLLGITVVLLALVPIGISQQAGTYLSDGDILDRDKADRRDHCPGESRRQTLARPTYLGATRCRLAKVAPVETK